jgi:hypothetical protein
MYNVSCSNQGNCTYNSTLGTSSCKCFDGFLGLDCKGVIPEKNSSDFVPPSLAINIGFYVGSSGYNYKGVNKNEPDAVPNAEWSDSFDLTNNETQLYLIKVCDDFFAQQDLVRKYPDSRCIMSAFRDFMQTNYKNVAFPITNMNELKKYMFIFVKRNLNVYGGDIGYIEKPAPRFTFVRYLFSLYVSNQLSGIKLEPTYSKWYVFTHHYLPQPIHPLLFLGWRL